MKPLNKTLPLVLAALAIGGVGFFFGRIGSPTSAVGDDHSPAAKDEHAHEGEPKGEESHAEEGVVKFDPEGLKLANIEVRTAQALPMPSGIVLTGQVAPNLSGVAKITPRVAGKVTSVTANVGDTVRSGETLATVASTELAEAQAAYRQARASLSLAQSNLQRQRRLAGLGEFGRHKVEEARGNLASLQAEVLSAQDEATATKAEIAEAESRLATARAAREQAESALRLAQSKLERAESLFREQIVSRQDLDQAEADARNAASALQAARASAAQAETGVASAKARLRFDEGKIIAARRKLDTGRQALSREEAVYRSGILTSREVAEAESTARKAELDVRAAADAVRLLGGTPGGGNVVAVTAPIPGRITERTVTLGETVGTDKTLFSLVNLASVWVELNAPQGQIARVRVGMPVRVVSQSLQGRTFQGVVANVGDVLDETSRTAKVRVVVENPGAMLKPGAFVSGTFVGPAASQARTTLAVPAEAVQDMEGRNVVFVQGDTEGEFRAAPVQTGEESAGLIEIVSGLEPGQRFVAKGALMVKAQAMKGELGHDH